MTDPIVFSKHRKTLGEVDWGTEGMKRWMDNHTCNEICKKISMVKDENLIHKLNTYLQKFETKQISEILQNLKVITGDQEFL